MKNIEDDELECDVDEDYDDEENNNNNDDVIPEDVKNEVSNSLSEDCKRQRSNPKNSNSHDPSSMNMPSV